MENNLSIFLNYDGEYASQWLKDAVIFTLKSNFNDPLIDSILVLSGIKDSKNKFLSELQNSSKLKILYKKKRIPGELGNSLITWVYYSLFWSFDTTNMIKVKDRKYQIVSQLALQFHYDYLAYITEIPEALRINIKSREYAAITVTRVIELLSKMVEYRSSYLTEKYFYSEIQNYLKNFIDVITYDYVEKDCLSITKNTAGKKELFLKYNNDQTGISFQLITSRKIDRGASTVKDKDNATIDREENRKILQYLQDGYIKYEKIKNKTIGKGKNNKKSNYYTKCKRDHITQKEFIVDTQTLISDDEDEEIELRRNKHARPALEVQVEFIPDWYKQRKINRAFSSSVAMQNLMLGSTYTVPPKENLVIFLKHISRNKFKKNFFEDDFFIFIFIFSLITGCEYHEVLELLLVQKSGSFTIDINKGRLHTKLDNKLFGREIEMFALKTTDTISFELPTEIINFFVTMQKKLETLSEPDVKKIHEMKEPYKSFIKEEINTCPIAIYINLDQMWKILIVYAEKLSKNKISTLYCVGKYTTLDRPLLSYGSTHKSGQAHGMFLFDIAKEIKLNVFIAELLDIKIAKTKQWSGSDKKMEGVGSKRTINTEKVKVFFSYLRRVMFSKEDEIFYFNMYAIYVRYSLSLLIGTRYGKVSCELKYISDDLGVIRIIEKDNDGYSGVRFIPLCPLAKNIIQKYKNLCSYMNIPSDNLYFIDASGKKRIIYSSNKKYLMKTILAYDLDENILEFIDSVPLNFGRHIIAKIVAETNDNLYYLRTGFGHYTKGAEQFGIVSTLNVQSYILKTSSLFVKIGKIYGV